MVKTYFIVTGLVNYNNKLLILKKSPRDRNYPNKWSFCSGYVKEFESAEDAVLREIKEETGLECEIKTSGKPIAVVDRDKRWFIATYLCTANSDRLSSHQFMTGGKTNLEKGLACHSSMMGGAGSPFDKVALSDENVEYRWVTKDELKNFDMVPGLMKDLDAVGFI